MIDFENDNPYAPPQSSGEIAYDGGINSQALQYLNSARKWALFVAIMSFLFVLLIVVALVLEPSNIVGTVINILITGLVGWFSLKYTQHAKNIQNTHNGEELSQCLSASTAVLKVYGIYFIVCLTLFTFVFVFAFIAGLLGAFR